MRAGLLNRQITIEQRTDAQDSFGQPVPGWTPLATEWAAVEADRGREYFAAAQIQAVAPVRFRIRYRSDVTPRHRVSYAGKLYDIKAVVDAYARERELHLYCDAGLTQG